MAARSETAEPEDASGSAYKGHGGLMDRFVVGNVDKFEAKRQALEAAYPSSPTSKKGPAGGFDSTPIPPAQQPGYTLKITIHRAENLPIADFATLSSDPYVVLRLAADLPRRHKQDPDMTLRTPTIHRSVHPEWNTEWIVGNVPASGFELSCRVFDEDPADHDDKLGIANLSVKSVNESWEGIVNQPFKISARRTSSKRAYFLRSVVSALSKDVHTSGFLYLSIECLGRTPDGAGARMYTIGPNAWVKHFSPLIGRLTGTKVSVQEQSGEQQVTRYNFQAVQLQLTGPVPAAMYHRYVEFKPFVAGMFTSHSLSGRILNRALHHQHARIYNYDRTTVYGLYPSPSVDLTNLFLDFVHYDQGGRIFTYVLTLDGLWRFTETGKEFGIDMLSKHTMHSDVSIYIAFSGEFFVRRIPGKHHHSRSGAEVQTDENTVIQGDPSSYELVIDNDSGTYRPNAQLLPQFQEFMSKNLPGLRVKTLDCQKNADEMQELKTEQRNRKKAATGPVIYRQFSGSLSSLSSFGSSSSSSSSSSDNDGERNHHGDGAIPARPNTATGGEGRPPRLGLKRRMKSWVAGDTKHSSTPPHPHPHPHAHAHTQAHQTETKHRNEHESERTGGHHTATNSL